MAQPPQRTGHGKRLDPSRLTREEKTTYLFHFHRSLQRPGPLDDKILPPFTDKTVSAPKEASSMKEAYRTLQKVKAKRDIVSLKKDVGFTLTIGEKFSNKLYKKKGYCYLRHFTKDLRKKAFLLLRENPDPYHTLALLKAFRLYYDLRYQTFALAYDFEPLHCHSFRAFSWSASEVARVLSSFRGLFIGAPRAAFQNALDLLGGTIHKDAVYDSYTAPVMRALQESQSICPNHISEPNFTLLKDKGLPVDANATHSHPHPAMKALEEQLLLSLSHTVHEPCTVAFMKVQKFRRLQNRNSMFSQLNNPVLTARDHARYGGTYRRMSKKVDTPNLFLHDSGHYLSPGEVAALFKNNPNVQRIYFSALLPDELVLGEPSWYPSLYRLSKLDSNLYSFTLSESGDSYEHPYSSLSWLKTNGIWLQNGDVHSVEIIHEQFAHKLFCVTRKTSPTHLSWRVTDSPDDVVLPEVDGRTYDHSLKRVPRKIFTSVLLHSMGLQTRRFTSVMSKVRTFQGNPQYQHIDADTWDALAQVCWALTNEVTTLEKEAPVDSYASLLARELRRFLHRHEWIQPILIALGVTVSWGSLLLPVFGIRIPDWNVRSGFVVPGWTYGALASLLAQIGLLAMGSGTHSTLKVITRSVALILPHLAYLLPDFQVSHDFTIPSFVGGIASSMAVTAAIALLDGRGSHYEVRDFLARMPHREQRRWPLLPIRVVVTDRDYLWHFDPTEEQPPPYSSRAPTHKPPVSENSNPTFHVVLHGNGSSRRPAWEFDGYSEAEEETPPLNLIEFGSETSSSTPTMPSAPEPPPSSDSIPPLEVFQHEDPAVLGFSPSINPSPPTGEPLRLRFGLREDQVFEPDSSFFSFCNLPEANTIKPIPLNRCLLTSLSKATGVSPEEAWEKISVRLPNEETIGEAVSSGGLSTLALLAFCYHYGVSFRILGDLPEGHPNVVGVRENPHRMLHSAEYRIYITPGHWDASPPQLFRGATSPPSFAPVEKMHRRPNRLEDELAKAKDWSGTKVIGQWHTYTTNPSRAKNYARDLKSGTTGTLSRQEGHGAVPAGFTSSMDSMVDNHTPRKVLMACVLGAPGSSKSSGLYPILSKSQHLSSNSWKLAVPRVKLRNSWKDHLKLERLSWKVGTFESNMFKVGKLLIVDEVSQMPPGYVDYVLINQRSIQSVLLIGDVTQGNFHEANADSTLNSLGSEALYFRGFCDQYRFFSNSIPRAVSSAIGLPTRSKHRGFITITDRAQTNYPIVVASESEQKMYSSMGYDSYTFGTVQGQRFPDLPVQIVISNATANMVSRGDFISSLCRSNIGVYFIFSGTQAAIRGLSSDPFLSSIFCGTTRLAYQDLFAQELAGLNLFTPAGLWDPISFNETVAGVFPHRPGVKVPMFRGGSLKPLGLCYTDIFNENVQFAKANKFGRIPKVKRLHEHMLEDPNSFALDEKIKATSGFVFFVDRKIEILHVCRDSSSDTTVAQWLKRAHLETPNFRVGMSLELPIDRASEPLKALMNPCPEELPEHVEHSKNFERGPATSGFDEDEEFLIQSYGELPAREDREEYDELLQSNLFNDSPWYHKNPDARYLEQLFPRHKNDDLLTFKKTVDKRLRFASQEVNQHRYTSRIFTGPILFDGWCRTTGIDPDTIPPFNETLYAQCIFENDFTKLTQKTQATLLNNADRADPDWRQTFVRIFMKSQLKVKMETLLSPFKAGQTLASFQDHVILITGPMTRYISIIDEKLQSPRYYYHPGHSPLELSSWCSEHWVDKPQNSTNDYTAFDQSQTAEAVALEEVNLRAHHIPPLVISFYIELKLSLSCQFGELAIMRFTGEGPTLKFNSDFNAALIGVQYVVNEQDARAISGDDSAINGVWPLRPGWSSFSRYLTIVAKPEVVTTAAFCSWLLTSHGAIKEPRVVFAKLLISRDRGEEEQVLPNLLNEVAVGYHVGDHVYQHLDYLQLATHFWLIRYFVRKAPIRFKLLLTTRSIEEVLRDVWASLDRPLAEQLQTLANGLGELWMLQSRPTRIAASVLTRVGGFALRQHKVFDHLLSTSYRY